MVQLALALTYGSLKHLVVAPLVSGGRVACASVCYGVGGDDHVRVELFVSVYVFIGLRSEFLLTFRLCVHP